MFARKEIIELYRKRATNYDFSANLYYLIGFREYAFRKRAIAALALRPGDTVVEIGCGTGLNFPLLQRAAGAQGKIIGVDLTDGMLARARACVERAQWSNVELIQADAAAYVFPRNVNGILSTFAITLVPEYEQVIRNGAAALAPHGRLVVLDLKQPDGAPRWLVRLGACITKPFGVTVDLTDRHPWEAIGRYLRKVSFTELYGGFGYISVGEAR